MPATLYQRPDLGAIYLPVGQMLQIDRVLESTNGRIVGEMDIGSHWAFPMHFPTDPIFPGCLLIEAAGQLVAIWAWRAGLRGKPRMAKVSAEFKDAIVPGDAVITLTATVNMRRHICLGTVELTTRNRPVATVKPVIVIVADANGIS